MNISELVNLSGLQALGMIVSSDGEILYPELATDAVISACNKYLNDNSKNIRFVGLNVAVQQEAGFYEAIDATPAFDSTTHEDTGVINFTAGNTTFTRVIVALPAETIALNLAKAKDKAIRKVDSDVDAIYLDAVGQRVPDYLLAEKEAILYRDAGYTGIVPSIIQDEVDRGSASTPQQATDNILALALALNTAKIDLRKKRLDTKAIIRQAAVIADVNTAMAIWGNNVIAIRSNLSI